MLELIDREQTTLRRLAAYIPMCPAIEIPLGERGPIIEPPDKVPNPCPRHSALTEECDVDCLDMTAMTLSTSEVKNVSRCTSDDIGTAEV